MKHADPLGGGPLLASANFSDEQDGVSVTSIAGDTSTRRCSNLSESIDRAKYEAADNKKASVNSQFITL